LIEGFRRDKATIESGAGTLAIDIIKTVCDAMFLHRISLGIPVSNGSQDFGQTHQESIKIACASWIAPKIGCDWRIA
jgi:hypothetical protein